MEVLYDFNLNLLLRLQFSKFPIFNLIPLSRVIIQDLFYNQPVRRKQLQSSPRKVLHILKECVLKIAIIHLKVSINVFDMESEVELLCTHPSSSPLPLLMSGLGLDPSISLHEFDVSDGTLKISGYISGPCEIIGGKAVQYVYINSRFVGKGPIHKLLSQLAAKFDNLGLCSDNNGSSNGKRFKMQNNPSYILNLGCPSSLYNLTFEPSKTSAKFKLSEMLYGQNAEIKKARRMRVPIVREDYLVDCLKRKKKLPFDSYKVEAIGETSGSGVVPVKVKGRGAVHEASGLQDTGHILEVGKCIHFYNSEPV